MRLLRCPWWFKKSIRFIWDYTADKIEIKHFKKFAKELGENMSDDKLIEMIKIENFLLMASKLLWPKKYI